MKPKSVSCPLAMCLTVLGIAGPIQAALLAFDPIATGSDPANGEYSAVGSIAGQGPTVLGFTGNWGGSSAGSVVATTSGLTYSDPNYFPASGGALQHNPDGRPHRSMDTTLADSFAGTGTIYLSFLGQFNTATAGNWGGYTAFEVGSGGDADATKALAIGRDNDQGLNGDFMYQINNGPKASLGAGNTDTNLFVVRFDLSTAAASDSVTMWMNPDLTGGFASDPSGGIPLGSGLDLFAINNIRFGSGGGAGNVVDEIRFGTTLESVIAVPEPGAALLGAIGALAVLRRRQR